jgi:hypothetical protein
VCISLWGWGCGVAKCGLPMAISVGVVWLGMGWLFNYIGWFVARCGWRDGVWLVRVGWG